jgi:hypothetical protein
MLAALGHSELRVTIVRGRLDLGSAVVSHVANGQRRWVQLGTVQLAGAGAFLLHGNVKP